MHRPMIEVVENSAHRLPKWQLVFILAALAAFGPLSIDMYLPAFPDLQRTFNTTAGPLGATLATFFVGLCLGQLIYGPLSDRVGRKKPLLFGLALYIAASLGCAMATGIESLLVLRFFQGLGSCSGMVVGRALVRDLFSPTETAQVFSTVMLVMGVAPILAPLFGQAVASHLGWRYIFYTVAAFAIVVWFGVVRLIPDRVSDKPGRGWSFTTFWEILCDRRFMGFAIAGTCLQSGLFAYITGFPTVVIEHFGFSPRSFSLLFGVNAVGLIGASQLNSWLLRRYTYTQIIEAVISVATLAGALVAYEAWHEFQSPLALLVPLFFFVASLGMAFPNSTAGALAEQGHQAGSASALLGTIQYGGAALASAAVGALNHYTLTGMGWIIAGCSVLSLVAFRVLLRD